MIERLKSFQKIKTTLLQLGLVSWKEVIRNEIHWSDTLFSLTFKGTRVANKTTNLLRYFSTLWRDDFSSADSLFRLWQTKLEILEEDLRRQKTLDSIFQANEVKLAIVLLDRINNTKDLDYHFLDSEKDPPQRLTAREYWLNGRSQDINLLLKIVEKRHSHWWY